MDTLLCAISVKNSFNLVRLRDIVVLTVGQAQPCHRYSQAGGLICAKTVKMPSKNNSISHYKNKFSNNKSNPTFLIV